MLKSIADRRLKKKPFMLFSDQKFFDRLNLFEFRFVAKARDISSNITVSLWVSTF